MTPVARRRLAGVVSGVLCLVALTACSTMKAGSAAIVGDEQLSQSDVTDITEEIDAALAADDLESSVPEDQVPLFIVASWVDATLVQALAEQKGVSVTPGEVDDFIANFPEENRQNLVVQRAMPQSQFERAVTAFLLQQDLLLELVPDGTQQEQAAALKEAMEQTADELGVSINPRFGSWNPAVPGVEPRDDSRLSSVDVSDNPTGPPLLPNAP